MRHALASSIIILVAAPAAHADDFALGAGVEVGRVSLLGVGSALGGLGGLGTVVETGPSAIFEARLSGSWWLTASADFAWSSNGDLDATAIGGDLGLRWVIDPAAVVRVAPTLSVGLGHSSYEYVVGDETDGTGPTRSDSLTVDAALGFDVEVALMRSLALRLATRLLSLAHTEQTVETPEVAATDSQSTSFAFGLRPEIQLVWSF